MISGVYFEEEALFLRSVALSSSSLMIRKSVVCDGLQAEPLLVGSSSLSRQALFLFGVGLIFILEVVGSESLEE